MRRPDDDGSETDRYVFGNDLLGGRRARLKLLCDLAGPEIASFKLKRGHATAALVAVGDEKVVATSPLLAERRTFFVKVDNQIRPGRVFEQDAAPVLFAPSSFFLLPECMYREPWREPPAEARSMFFPDPVSNVRPFVVKRGDDVPEAGWKQAGIVKTYFPYDGSPGAEFFLKQPDAHLIRPQGDIAAVDTFAVSGQLVPFHQIGEAVKQPFAVSRHEHPDP